MKIEYKNKRLEILLQNNKMLLKKYGKQNSEKITQRLNELVAIENLGLMIKFRIGRCHPLKGNYKGMFALDLKHPMRIIFNPIFESEYDKENNNYYKVKKVRIMEVVNYHD